MPIPSLPRVKYSKNTLAEVVCQLRFPRILKVASAAPVGFQERIRADYPLFEERATAAMQFPVASGVPMDLGSLMPGVTSYEFVSAEKNWRLSLTRDFIALTTDAYDRWEGFRARMDQATCALSEEYKPAFLTRVGLRYQNVIVRSRLGLDGVPWSELLKECAVGELATDLASGVRDFSREAVLALDRFDSRARVRQEIVRAEGSPEECFLIDCDFYTEKRTEIADAVATLNFLNEQSRNLFRFYVRDRLHSAMEPRLVAGTAE